MRSSCNSSDLGHHLGGDSSLRVRLRRDGWPLFRLAAEIPVLRLRGACEGGAKQCKPSARNRGTDDKGGVWCRRAVCQHARFTGRNAFQLRGMMEQIRKTAAEKNCNLSGGGSGVDGRQGEQTGQQPLARPELPDPSPDYNGLLGSGVHQ